MCTLLGAVLEHVSSTDGAADMQGGAAHITNLRSHLVDALAQLLLSLLTQFERQAVVELALGFVLRLQLLILVCTLNLQALCQYNAAGNRL